jgi:hypothetical protein
MEDSLASKVTKQPLSMFTTPYQDTTSYTNDSRLITISALLFDVISLLQTLCRNRHYPALYLHLYLHVSSRWRTCTPHWRRMDSVVRHRLLDRPVQIQPGPIITHDDPEV